MVPPVVAQQARLTTGDWVVLRRADPGPLGFLGKVSDGEWDPRDDALLRARVDTTSNKPVWFAVGDLERIEPTDEAGLVEAALLEGLVPADRAERLRTDLAALRAGALPYVRSPGLLDRLWAALPTDPAQRSGGLAAFFDEGQRALHDVRNRRWAPASLSAPPPLEPPAEIELLRILERPLFALPDDFELEIPEDWLADVVLHDWPRPTSRFEAVQRVLHGLPRWSLAGVVERLGRSELRLEPADTIRATLLGEGLTLARLLGALSPAMIRSAPRLLGLPEVKGLADRTIEAWLLGTFGGLPEVSPEQGAPLPGASLEALPPLPAWSPPGTPASEVGATWRLLGLVRGRELAALCGRFGDSSLAELGGARQVCEGIARSDRGLRRLLPALPQQAFRHAPWALGLAISGGDEAITAELLRRYPPTARATLTPAPETDDPLLPRVVQALTLGELTLTLLGLGSEAPVDAALAPILRAEGYGARDLLSHLGPGALRRVATACGVPSSIEAPEQLHAAILSLEPSPFA